MDSGKVERQEGFFKLHLLVDVDTRRILAFSISDMNGGDAAHLPALLNQLMKKCADEEIPLKEPIANLVINDVPRTGVVDHGQTLLDRWSDVYKEPPVEEITLNERDLNRVDSVLSEKLRRIRNKKMGVRFELRGWRGPLRTATCLSARMPPVRCKSVRRMRDLWRSASKLRSLGRGRMRST